MTSVTAPGLPPPPLPLTPPSPWPWLRPLLGVGLVGALLAAALPSLLGAAGRAQDGIARGDLAAIAPLARAMAQRSHGAVSLAGWDTSLLGLRFALGSVADSHHPGPVSDVVALAVIGGRSPEAGVGLAELTPSGTCWRLWDPMSGSISTGALRASLPSACTAPGSSRGLAPGVWGARR